MAKYDEIWHVLKTTGTAEFTVSTEAERRILNGIKLVKTTENTARRAAGLIGWSKLVIERTPLSTTHVRIKLSFLFSTVL